MDYEHASDSLNPGNRKDLSIDQRTANAEAFVGLLKAVDMKQGFILTYYF